MNKQKLLWSINGINILLLLMLVIFRKNPEFCELIYGQLFYPTYQFLRSGISFLLPFPLFYIPFLIVLFFIVRWIRCWVLRKIDWRQFCFLMVTLLLSLLSGFYLLWGFHYSRPSLQKKMGLTMEVPDSLYIIEDFKSTIDHLNKTRIEIAVADTIPWYGQIHHYSQTEVHKTLIQQVGEFLSPWGYKNNFRAFVKLLSPKGSLLIWQTSGMMFPFTGEGYCDEGMPLLTRPNVIAHEASHVFGVTNEGECNFVAHQVGIRSSDPLVRYSSFMSYFHYASKAMYDIDSVGYSSMITQLDTIVIRDMNSRRRAIQQFPDLFPEARDQIYDRYLKSQGVKRGIQDYHQIYLLNYAFQKRGVEAKQ